MALIKCPNCGKQMSDRALACPHCGMNKEVQEGVASEGQESASPVDTLKNDPEEVGKSITEEVPANESQSEAEVDSYQEYDFDEENKGHKNLWTTIIALALILICVGGFYAYKEGIFTGVLSFKTSDLDRLKLKGKVKKVTYDDPLFLEMYFSPKGELTSVVLEEEIFLKAEEFTRNDDELIITIHSDYYGDFNLVYNEKGLSRCHFRGFNLHFEEYNEDGWPTAISFPEFNQKDSIEYSHIDNNGNWTKGRIDRYIEYYP